MKTKQAKYAEAVERNWATFQAATTHILANGPSQRVEELASATLSSLKIKAGIRLGDTIHDADINRIIQQAGNSIAKSKKTEKKESSALKENKDTAEKQKTKEKRHELKTKNARNSTLN